MKLKLQSKLFAKLFVITREKQVCEILEREISKICRKVVKEIILKPKH